MNDPYALPIALLIIYFRRISLSGFTIQTFRVCHWTIQSERKPFQYNNEWYFSYQSISPNKAEIK